MSKEVRLYNHDEVLMGTIYRDTLLFKTSGHYFFNIEELRRIILKIEFQFAASRLQSGDSRNLHIRRSTDLLPPHYIYDSQVLVGALGWNEGYLKAKLFTDKYFNLNELKLILNYMERVSVFEFTIKKVSETVLCWKKFGF